MRGRWGSLRIAALAVLAALVCVLHSEGAAAQTQGGPVASRRNSKASRRRPTRRSRPRLDQAAKEAKDAEDASAAAKQRAELAPLERQLAEVSAASASHSLALTYATIGLIVVSASLWLMAFLQARDLKAAVRAVQESAAGARSAAEATQRALVLTQRATVIVGEPRAAWLRDANDRLVGCRLLVTWHNVGPTPTRNMIAAVAGQATERPPPRTSAMPKADAPAAAGDRGAERGRQQRLRQSADRAGGRRPGAPGLLPVRRLGRVQRRVRPHAAPPGGVLLLGGVRRRA